MNDTLRTSNKVNIILIILFILFLVGVIGYIVVRQRSNTAGEFPNVSADSLVASNASITLSGPDTIADAGSDYDLILDTKGEVVSSVNIELGIPTKDISISVAKGSIANFENGTFSSSTDTSSNTAKIQITTNANTTFNGAGILAKVTLKRLPTSSGTSVAVSVLKTSYLKLVGYAPKGFTAASSKTYALTIVDSGNQANNNTSTATATLSSSATAATPQVTTTSTPTSTSTATQTTTAANTAVSTATPVPSTSTATSTAQTTVASTSTQTATIVAQVTTTPQSTSTSTKTATATVAASTSTKTATVATTTKTATSVAATSNATSSTGTLPITSVADDNSLTFLYLAIASLITGLATLMITKKNSLRMFERSFEK